MKKSVQHSVRNYEKGDEDALAKIFSECFGHVTPALIRRWHKQASIRPEDVFIGVANGKVVSHVNTEEKQLHHGEGVFIKTAGVAGVCTDSDFRKKGILTNLLNLTLRHAQEEGYSNASLFTDTDGPGHGIYQRCGFVDIITARSYLKYIDYLFVFARWVRSLNLALKDSKLAIRKLEGWDKTVAAHIAEVGVLCFRFRNKKFRHLGKPPKKSDIQFRTDLQTYAKILRGAVQWKDAVESRKVTLQKGDPADIEMLKRILRWDWRN